MFTTFVALNNVQPTCNFEITHLAHKIFEFKSCELGYGQDNPGLNSRQRQEILLFSKPPGWFGSHTAYFSKYQRLFLHIPLLLTLRKRGAIPLLPIHSFMVCIGNNFTF